MHVCTYARTFTYLHTSLYIHLYIMWTPDNNHTVHLNSLEFSYHILFQAELCDTIKV